MTNDNKSYDGHAQQQANPYNANIAYQQAVQYQQQQQQQAPQQQNFNPYFAHQQVASAPAYQYPNTNVESLLSVLQIPNTGASLSAPPSAVPHYDQSSMHMYQQQQPHHHLPNPHSTSYMPNPSAGHGSNRPYYNYNYNSGGGGGREGGGGRQNNYSSHSRHGAPYSHNASDRKPVEYESRTLLILNVPSVEAASNELVTLCSKYGTVKTTLYLPGNNRRGATHVTFFDIRDSIKAKENIHDKEQMNGKALEAYYARPKSEDISAFCDATKEQGTLYLTILNDEDNSGGDGATAPVTEDEMKQFFTPFGELKSIRPFNSAKGIQQQTAWFVEFYDSRACQKAFDSIIEDDSKIKQVLKTCQKAFDSIIEDDSKIKQVLKSNFRIEYAWDLSKKARMAALEVRMQLKERRHGGGPSGGPDRRRRFQN
ncbi:hypothetical protein MP638_001490 [Amoeboaphelidium occidentale]|nr:hypothetical protein MP638_001490 [Amoeboaphelidium occidentale]